MYGITLAMVDGLAFTNGISPYPLPLEKLEILVSAAEMEQDQAEHC
jgi:hypothetical protein